MSDTPRTDAAAIRCACSIYVVPSEFAHQLERENAALRAALTPWLAWEDAGGEIAPNAARELLRIARIALEKHRKEPT